MTGRERETTDGEAGTGGRDGGAGEAPPRPRPARLGRFEALDRRPVNLDGFAQRDDEAGLVAFASANDPEPSVALDADGRVIELDGHAAADFDLIDAFIAARGLDPVVAEEANAIDDVAFARLIVDPNVPRAEVVRLAAGATPEKLARVVALLRPVELQMAVSKLRVRKTPSNQAHVTNRLDDPLLLAADAATAVAYGFREVETTVPVNADAPSNALAVLIGSQVGAGGALTQCSIEEALELELGLRGLTTYAETVSLYGTEKVFIDGDDTPWSKAFLCSAYASRGLKMRVTSGGGAEALMGAAEGRSMFSLESRCVALARAMGAQGVQNGGIDGASVVGCVPDGMRELLAENLLVMLRDLESCSGNDALVSESDMRRTAHTVPLFLAGSDFLFSGFGSIPRYDNMFGPSNFNAEDLDDYLVLQRDWGVDGALRPVTEDGLRAVRERAARACLAVYRELGLVEAGEAAPAGFGGGEVATRRGSRRSSPPRAPRTSRRRTRRRSWRRRTRSWTGRSASSTSCALSGRPGSRRRPGACSPWGAPASPATTCRRRRSSTSTCAASRRSPTRTTTRAPAPATRCRRRAGSRSPRSASSARAPTCWRGTPPARRPRRRPGHGSAVERGEARPGTDPREVCVGVSPALATKLWFTMSGLPVGEALAADRRGHRERRVRRPPRARAVHRRPRGDRTDRRRAGGLGRRRRPAGQGHGAHPPQGTRAARVPGTPVHRAAAERRRCTASSAPTPPATPRASGRRRCATRTPTRPSRRGTTPRWWR